MSDNTKQFRWIVVIWGGIAALYREDPDVFVAGNILWYPVEGEPTIRIGPDVLVAFGRPKGDRGSYMQWQEDAVAPQIVFEVLSPRNTYGEMSDKLAFYDEHGVEEYYVYDPDNNQLVGYLRQGTVLRRIRPIQGHTSPRLKIRFDTSGPELIIYRPDGKCFLTYEEAMAAAEAASLAATTAEARATIAETRATTAETRATTAETRATTAEQRAARIAVLGRKARRGDATPEELTELDRLEQELSLPAS